MTAGRGEAAVVLGYGAVGRETAALLARQGREVVVAQRTEPARLPDGVTFRRCDLTDATATRAAVAGCATVILAAGLPYTARVFTTLWPVVMRNALDAAAAAGARLVFADNLYCYGPQTVPLREDMPLTNYGGKPKARAAITRLWQEAHAAGRVEATAVRASDFYGPDAPTSVISAYGVARLAAGRRAMSPYPADYPHAFTYIPDFARAIVTLADAPADAFGQAWHVPNAPARTLREVIGIAAGLLGVAPRLSVMPDALRRLLGLFNPVLAELGEMRFQWDRPYQVDASRYLSRFGGEPTPLEAGLAATVSFYRAAA